MLGESTIHQIDQALIEDLKTELREQGHYLTGDLEASINAKKINDGEEIYAEDYIDPLNEGIAPQNYRGDIAGLTRYAELRFGATGKEAVRIANAIAKKHAIEGMPTAASYAFSANGRRTKAITETFENNPDIDPAVEEGLSKEIDDLFAYPDLTVF